MNTNTNSNYSIMGMTTMATTVGMLMTIGSALAQKETAEPFARGQRHYETLASLYQRDVLDGYFYKAKINWANLDDEYAAIEIKKAAAFIEQVTNVDQRTKTLLKPYGLLKTLEKDLRQGRVQTLYQLQGVFAQVHAFLADFHSTTAATLRRNNLPTDAARALRIAYHHLFHAVTWSGLNLDYAKFNREYNKSLTWRDNRNALEQILSSTETEGKSAKEKQQLADATAFLEFGVRELRRTLGSGLW